MSFVFNVMQVKHTLKSRVGRDYYKNVVLYIHYMWIKVTIIVIDRESLDNACRSVFVIPLIT